MSQKENNNSFYSVVGIPYGFYLLSYWEPIGAGFLISIFIDRGNGE